MSLFVSVLISMPYIICVGKSIASSVFFGSDNEVDMNFGADGSGNLIAIYC